MKQPYCRYCGTPIRKHTRTVWFEDELLPHMKSDNWSRHVVGRPSSKAEAQRLVNETVVSLRLGRTIKDEQGFSTMRGDLIGHVTTWDGESYVNEYFCNDKHASAFAYAVLHHQPTLGMPAYHEAIEIAKRKEHT